MQEIARQQAEFSKAVDGFFPQPFKAEFERRFVAGRMDASNKRTQRYCHWRAAQRVVLDVKLDPSDWIDEQHGIYDHFYRKHLSLSYTQKIISMMNLWGALYLPSPW